MCICGQICEELMTRCLAPDCQMGGLGCDNMTVILVCFLHPVDNNAPGDYADLCQRCSHTLNYDSNDAAAEESPMVPPVPTEQPDAVQVIVSL